MAVGERGVKSVRYIYEVEIYMKCRDHRRVYVCLCVGRCVCLIVDVFYCEEFFEEFLLSALSVGGRCVCMFVCVWWCVLIFVLSVRVFVGTSVLLE